MFVEKGEKRKATSNQWLGITLYGLLIMMMKLMAKRQCVGVLRFFFSHFSKLRSCFKAWPIFAFTPSHSFFLLTFLSLTVIFLLL